MSAIQGEDVLAVVRTHPKILFKPAVLQVVLLAAHVLLAIYWPRNLGPGRGSTSGGSSPSMA